MKSLAALMLVAGIASADVSVGINYPTYKHDLVDANPGFKAAVGEDIYLYGSYENPDHVHQGNIDIWSGGLGIRERSGNMEAFGEFGLYKLDANGINLNFQSKYGGQIGVGYYVTDHIKATVDYRFLRAYEERKRSIYDLSGVRFGLHYKF